MTTETLLRTRSGDACELCGVTDGLEVLLVSPRTDDTADACLLACATCRDQIVSPESLDVHHWRCLANSMWSQEAPVQVIAWRMLTRLSGEGWARDLLDQLYLDETTLAWAEEGVEVREEDASIVHKDSNGAILVAGDTVTLIKDLNVKGGGFTAKRGTAVRGIRLVPDNAAHIEGRVEGQTIVILTEFVKKSG